MNDRIEKLRDIAGRYQAAVVDGVLVDAFSASAVVGVYDRLSPENKAKFDSLPVGCIVDAVLRVMSRQGMAKA